MDKIAENSNQLIEEIGLAIEERVELTPLAARLYASLILSSTKGLNYQEIIEIHQASKSSVSNNLSVLVNLNYVEYYTKPGERKRYFRTSKYYVKTAMEKYSKLLEKDIQMIEKISAFNKKNNPEKFKNEQSGCTMYQEYLSDLRKGFQSRIKQIEQEKNQS